MKKTLAILLTLALVICMIPGSAFAETAAAPLAATVTLNNGETETVYNGADQTPAVAVSVNNSPVSGSTVEWTPAEVKNAGTYTVKVSGTVGSGETAQAYEGKATYIVRAVDLVRATIINTGALTTDDLNSAKTELASYDKVKVVQDGVDITEYCTLTSKVTGSAVRVTAEVKADKVDGVNVIKSSKFADFTVKSTLAGYEISAIGEQTYTGKAVTPYVTVKAKNGYETLISGTHYTVTYSNNVHAGSAASVTVTGIGNYTGVLTGQFVIAQRPLNSSDIVVNVADAAYNNGYYVIPKVIVTHGDKTLVHGTDYNVTSTSTQIGTGTVTITGMGNYKGQITRNFNIVDASKELTYANTFVYIGNRFSNGYTASYNGQPQTPAVTVYVGSSRDSAVLLSSMYYDVVYTNNVKPGYATVIVTGKNGYAGSSTNSFNIAETEITNYNTTVSGYYDSYAYNGTYHRPEVYVNVNGYALKNGVDYTVTYSNNKNMSTTYSKAQIIITAIEGSGYTGSISKEFTITGKSILACTASYTNDKGYSAYTGYAIVPSITVKDGYYNTLRQGTDYTISYRDANGKDVASMKDAGTYTVVITGKGNYSGETTLSYEITGYSIANYTVTLKENSVKADGLVKKPVISSVKYGLSSLKAADYTVSYQDSKGNVVTSLKTPGTYYVVVTGKGGYSGSIRAAFTIVGERQEINVGKTEYKVYTDSDKIKISASATGDGTGFEYVSSDPTVASVSASGVVTVHKLGRAKITVTTTGVTKSNPVSEDIIVKVYPKKAVMTQKPWTESKNGSLRVRWEKQDDVTYYEVRYSRDKSFKKGSYKTKKVTASELNYDTQSTRISGLKSGYKYYVKVRAVKVVTDDQGKEVKYYGSWSGWKSRVTK